MILEALFTGKIYPEEKVVTKDPRRHEIIQRTAVLMNELEELLSEEDYKRVIELYDGLTTLEGLQSEEQFKYGFSLGMLLMKEVCDLPYFNEDE